MSDFQGVLTLLGFAQKAKKLAAGDSNVDAYLKKGRICLLLLAEDLAPGRQAYWQRVGADNSIPVATVLSKAVLGQAIGMSPRSVIGILDEKMAAAIVKKINGL